MFGRRKRTPSHVPLEAQLQILAAHGIALRDDRTIDELLISFSRDQYEAEPYSLLFWMLGHEVEEDPLGRYFCDSIYAFDAECIEDTCDYKFIVERLSEITGGDLPLEAVSDEIDIEAGAAHIEFRLDGALQSFTPEVNDDWFDPEVIGFLANLLASRGGTRRFFYYNTGDQNIVIACLTLAQAKALMTSTGLELTQLP